MTHREMTARDKAREYYKGSTVEAIAMRSAYERGHRDGYEYAKTDPNLSLTWEDVMHLSMIENGVCGEIDYKQKDINEVYPTNEEYYKEILRRFKEVR